tara:strand:- start:1385 stop:1951 length:567 start_codon:yes stop_codon:yes gene_type:complete
MTENVERAKEAMMNISLSLGLPENYRGDLDQDLETLSKAPAGKWLWLLRTSGTVLVPLNVGVHPVYVNYWLESNHGQKVVCFMVDPQKGMLTQTSFVSAKQLIAQAPKILNASMSREELVGAVHSVLEEGCERRLWGIFDSPSKVDEFGSWQEWQTYFRSTENNVMADFMAKAVRFARAHQSTVGQAL